MDKVTIMDCSLLHSMECRQDDSCLHSMVPGTNAINDRVSVIIKWAIQ